MRKRLFFLVVLVSLLAGIGMGAVAEDEKWSGNAAALLATSHASKGVACNQCHATSKPEPVATAKCLTCHGNTEALAQRTANVKPTNPHDSRHFGTEADCNLCHRVHKKSENLCADCHPRFNFKVP